MRGSMEVASCQLPEAEFVETLRDQLFSVACHCPGLGIRESG